MSQSHSGKVKFYHSEKAFGFITNDNNGKETFFHVTGLAGDTPHLKQGDQVIYNIESGKKGPKAVDIELAN